MPHQIDMKAIHNNDPIAWANLVWAYDKSEVKSAFDDIGIKVQDKNDLMTLAKLAKTGGDVAGDLKTQSGKSKRFNFLDIVKNKIPFKDEQFKRKIAVTSDKTFLVKDE